MPDSEQERSTTKQRVVTATSTLRFLMCYIVKRERRSIQTKRSSSTDPAFLTRFATSKSGSIGTSAAPKGIFSRAQGNNNQRLAARNVNKLDNKN